MDLSNENIVHVKKDGYEYLQFKKLLQYPELWHAFVIKPLNFRGNKAEKIIAEDYEKICNYEDLDYKYIVRALQEHTDVVKNIVEKKNSSGPEILMEYLNNVDGLVTDKKDFILATTSADCITLLMYDPVNKIIANVHSGWKGTFKKISLKAIEKMKTDYNSKPEDIIVCICPSIRKCHFEVKTDVESECRKIFEYTNKLDEIIKFKGIENDEEKFYIDTVLITKLLLEEAGIEPENIIDSEICTLCNKEILHTRRGDGDKFGLNVAMIKLNL